MATLESFPPIVNKRSEILILGSMPGVKSLEAVEYYAHPQNQFWKIMAELLKYPVPLTYTQKKKMLLANKIALWDVVGTCKRRGSLDSDIRDVKPNDIEGLLKNHPRIAAVFCNGNTALKLFKKYHPACNLPVKLLPSTSPAYTKPYLWKKNTWQRAIGIIRKTKV